VEPLGREAFDGALPGQLQGATTPPVHVAFVAASVGLLEQQAQPRRQVMRPDRQPLGLFHPSVICQGLCQQPQDLGHGRLGPAQDGVGQQQPGDRQLAPRADRRQPLS